MEIRRIRPDEEISKCKIQSIAFHLSRDFSKPPENAGTLLTNCDTGRAAFNDKGKMCSCLDLIPFDIRFGGKTVKMGGIGGVASLPEERHRRYIRSIFEYVMAEMYEKGYTFSYLYPFSHQYYRKFGYELNMTLRSYSIGASSFRHFEQAGRMELNTGEDPLDVKRIYDEFISDKNLAVVRTDKLWKRFLEKDPYRDNVYLYVWHDSSDEARGYIQFNLEKLSAARYNLRIHELIWLDRPALTGILGFLSRLSSQVDKILWRSPEFLNLLALFPEPYDVAQEIITYGMNRVVNAEKALQAMSAPSGGGEATIAVNDDFFPENTGSYKLSWEGGRHAVSRTQSPPDISCGIQALSQLVTGYISAGELAFAGRAEVRGNEAALSHAFPKKPLFINNYF